jgi:hypothetical protein
VSVENNLQLTAGICQFRPRGTCTLVEAVDIIRRAVGYCRHRGIARLLVDGRGLSGIPIPTLIDRFLMAEDWAEAAKGMVIVSLVVHEEYIHPEKFGVKVAAAFGLTLDVFSSESKATEWLSSVDLPEQD